MKRPHASPLFPRNTYAPAPEPIQAGSARGDLLLLIVAVWCGSSIGALVFAVALTGVSLISALAGTAVAAGGLAVYMLPRSLL